MAYLLKKPGLSTNIMQRRRLGGRWLAWYCRLGRSQHLLAFATAYRPKILVQRLGIGRRGRPRSLIFLPRAVLKVLDFLLGRAERCNGDALSNILDVSRS